MSVQWFLDEVSQSGGTLRVRGWAFDPARRIVRATLRVGAGSEGLLLASFGAESPDVAAVFGQAAARARFDESIALPRERELTFEFGYEDGTVQGCRRTITDSDQLVWAKVESPVTGDVLEPLDFYVSGWAHAKEDHRALLAVEVWSGDELLGTDAQLHVRADVCSSIGVPAECATGFVVTCHRVGLAAGIEFTFSVRAKFRDGSARVLHPPGVTVVRTLPLERAPLSALRTLAAPGALGVEIGAHAAPATGVTPYYMDVTPDFAGREGRVDFLADGQALPLADNALDYLCSSHVLEHLPNPLAALIEWHRVLRPGGLLYLVVPDKRFTFDAPRALTAPEHLLRDFLVARTTAGSIQHIREFVYETDWSRLQPGCLPADVEKNRRKAYDEYVTDAAAGRLIGIHFHTFVPDSLRRTLRRARLIDSEDAQFEVVSSAERYPSSRGDGIGFLLRKRGGTPGGVAVATGSGTFRLRSKHSPVPALPLVCPLTLAPLREESGELVSSARPESRYKLLGNCPNLVPADNARIGRKWSGRMFRLALYLRAQFRR